VDQPYLSVESWQNSLRVMGARIVTSFKQSRMENGQGELTNAE